MTGLGKVSLIGLGVIAGIVSVMGVQLASAQSRSNAVAAGTRVLTADTDIARLRSGYTAETSGPERQLLVSGPFVLTDVVIPRPGTWSASVYIVPGSQCSSSGNPALETKGAIQGTRLPVPSGSVACLRSTASVYWSGFVPY